MRARLYSPEIKRFVNQDVLLGNIGDGQSLNRFAFVINNPITFIDPYGKSATAIVSGWISTDATIPDPTDAAWPKWLAYGTALSGGSISRLVNNI